MIEQTRTCQLCYSDYEVFDTNEGVILKCQCYLTLVKAPTLEEAYKKLDAFELELEQGANLWGSKINAGVAED